MGRWSKKISKKISNMLAAAGIVLVAAASSLALPIAASAARTVTDNVMIRNDASTDAGIIGSLNEGDEVVILDVMQSGDGYAWYYIQLDNGATGYVRSDLIEADDSELAAFQGQAQEETEEAAEAQPEQTEETAEEAPAAEEEAPAAEQADPAPSSDGSAQPAAGAEGYDATKDPNANFRTGYEEEADGTVTWYVYNDDNGSKIRISDLAGQQNAAPAAAGVSKVWRAAAILLGILALALFALVLFLVKSIRDGRSKTTRGRALEARASAGENEDEEDEDEEFYFEDDEDEYDEEPDTDSDPVSDSDSGSSGEETDNAGDSGNVSPETERNTEVSAEKSLSQDAEQAQTRAEEKSEAVKSGRVITPDSTITMDIPDEVTPTAIPAQAIAEVIEQESAETKGISEDHAPDDKTFEDKTSDNTSSDGNASGDMTSGGKVTKAAAEDPRQEYEEDPEDDYYDDSEEEYEDEEYEDEEYEEEDYDDEEEPADRSVKKNSSKGGFFGFLKKVFGSESEEDEEDGEDFDDYEDEPEEHEFDEFKEYPEDVDLLPREDADDRDYLEDEEQYEDTVPDTKDSGRSRLSMQRVMKNVGYKEEEKDFSQDDDYEDSLFEDDDDMEYSFISNRKK